MASTTNRRGVVFTWGADKDTGALGHQIKDKDGHCPMPIPVGLSGCISVCAAQNLTAAITELGELYTWGKGPALGHVLGEKNGGVVAKPALVKNMKSHFVTNISLGSMHALCLCCQGDVYVWGNNRKGQLGIGDKVIEQITPVNLDHFSTSDYVVGVQCCDLYSAALTKSGVLFTWGSSVCLGHSSYPSKNNLETPLEFNPRQVRALETECVTQVSLGSLYMGCCTLKGEAYTWGYGGHGNLGLGDRKSIGFPTRVPIPDRDGTSKKAVFIACTTSQQSMGGGINPKNPGQEGPHTLLIVQSTVLNKLQEEQNQIHLSQDIGRTDAKQIEVCKENEEESYITEINQPIAEEKGEEKSDIGIDVKTELYSFGTCHKGLCGNLQAKTLSAPYDELTPYLVGSKPRDLSTKSLNQQNACRSLHSTAADSEEEDGCDGAVDNDENVSRAKLLGNVVGASCSSIHNLVWNERGELYAFGCGSGGRCGVGYFVIGANPNKPRKSRMKAYMSAPNKVGCVWPPTTQHKQALQVLSLETHLEGGFVKMAASSRYHGVCIADLKSC